MKGLPVSEILLFLCHHRILMSHRTCTSCVELSPKNDKGTGDDWYKLPSNVCFRNTLAIRIPEHPFESRGKSRASRKIHNAQCKALLRLKSKLPSVKESRRLSNLSLDRATLTAKGLQSGMKSKKSLQDIESTQASQKSSSRSKDTAEMSTAQLHEDRNTPSHAHFSVSRT